MAHTRSRVAEYETLPRLGSSQSNNTTLSDPLNIQRADSYLSSWVEQMLLLTNLQQKQDSMHCTSTLSYHFFQRYILLQSRGISPQSTHKIPFHVSYNW